MCLCFYVVNSSDAHLHRRNSNQQLVRSYSVAGILAMQCRAVVLSLYPTLFNLQKQDHPSCHEKFIRLLFIFGMFALVYSNIKNAINATMKCAMN
jgi:hypothetical protein